MKHTILYTGVLALALLITGCAAENPVSSVNSATEASTTETQLTEESMAATGTTVTTSENTATTTFEVTVADAIQVYQETFPDSDITSIELDSSFGHYYYQIEGVDDTKEYEIKVDATTKEITKNKEETLDKDEQNGVKRQEDKLDLTDLLSVEEVTEIALAEVSSGEPTDWDLDREMNITYWEVQIKDGKTETNIKINAQTGEVLEVELDD